MIRWLLISLTIVLVVAAPALSFHGAFDVILQMIQTVMKLKVGGFKFLQEFYQYEHNEVADYTPSHHQMFDFIVVGAGSAGAAVASRLSEDRQTSVLLLEAGGHENLLMDVPLAALFLQMYDPINWAYLTEPSNNYCRGAIGQQCKLAKGRVLGGSSTINFMIAIRGNRYDYDEWAAQTGDENWSYDGMLKTFKKLETFDGPLVNVDPAYHNFDGPLRIAHPPFQSPLVDAFIEAGQEMGFAPVDYNGENQTGFSYIQATQINGERMSSNRAYLHPVKKRRNLKVSMNSFVTKVLIDPDSKIAYGVEFTKNDRTIEVLARKEVILSAGAIATPQLLMLSGIGPDQHLRNQGIHVIQNLPVGENLMDHVAYGGLTFLINDTQSIVVPEFFQPDNPTLNDYFYRRDGFMSTAGGVEALGYVNVDDPRQENDRPNMELLFASVSILSDRLIHVPFGISDTHWKLFASKLHKHSWIIWPLLMKPKSRGRILLKSRNPREHPRILANYFSDPDDVRICIKGIRMAIEVSKTQAMQRFNSRLYDINIPGCERYVKHSDEYWECALRTYTITLWHHSGTCKMGREEDPSAVVNSRLQVKGIKRLRVVDLSIMPNIVTAHTNVPAIAIGEKASDIIKSDWKLLGATQ